MIILKIMFLVVAIIILKYINSKLKLDLLSDVVDALDMINPKEVRVHSYRMNLNIGVLQYSDIKHVLNNRLSIINLGQE